MASIGCSIDAIIEKVENIQKILKKYEIATQGIGSWAATKGFNISIDIALSDWFAKMPGNGLLKSLYDDVSKVFNYLKQGSEFIKDAKREYDNIVKDFGDVVNNIEGIMQDLKDMTVIDIQVLELDLAKLGLNPGEIITRIKNGEDPDEVLGSASDKLSTSSQALLGKLSKPLSINIDTVCQKLPNVQIVEIGSVRTAKVLPAKPQAVKPGGEVAAQTLTPISTIQVRPNMAEYAKNIGGADKKYNWQYLCNGHDVPKFYHAFSDAAVYSAAGIIKDKGNIALANEITPEKVKMNLDAIGKHIVAPLKAQYGKDILITSGWRSDPFTSKGGISNHSIGCAVDFQFPASAAHLFKQKNNPIKFLMNLLSELNVEITTEKAGKLKVGNFRLIREFRESDPQAFTYPTVFHLDANFVFSTKGNRYGVLPRSKMPVASGGKQTGSISQDKTEPY